MQFVVRVTTGGEVTFGGQIPGYRPIYYGGPPPDSGTWRVDLNWIGDFLSERFAQENFGDSVEVFMVGFELADLKGWGERFTDMEKYMSYRRTNKWLISVAQLDWLQVKDLTSIEQFKLFSEASVAAVERIGLMKRKPKMFDYSSCAAKLKTFFSEASTLDEWRYDGEA